VPTDRYREPVLVSGADGVGTKLKLAFALDRHDTVGIDLVAMCVNDVLVHGAEPLFFLDYFATAQLQPNLAKKVLQGIGQGCELAGVALLGGETAEMPGMYARGEYDLAGFCVGVAEKSELIDGSAVTPGDVLIGLASSGLHSNGYSLVRRILEETDTDLEQPFHQRSLGSVLLEPTRIYVNPMLKLKQSVNIHAIAHITGGGLPGNVIRVLPDHIKAVIDSRTWERPALFAWIQQQGNVDVNEMYHTFNCGIGMIVSVAAEQAQQALAVLQSEGEHATIIGHVESTDEAKHVQIR
ncbi:MAG: phosphoribosylformylglycinamidine cyclo-ligase, partial [Gammaproteobacteria bacterium]|nr:phosphoribosylformylglycinamidine cyclo-ligase [Gammaproteobacteria bacterium]